MSHTVASVAITEEGVIEGLTGLPDSHAKGMQGLPSELMLHAKL